MSELVEWTWTKNGVSIGTPSRGPSHYTFASMDADQLYQIFEKIHDARNMLLLLSGRRNSFMQSGTKREGDSLLKEAQEIIDALKATKEGMDRAHREAVDAMLEPGGISEYFIIQTGELDKFVDELLGKYA